MKSKEKKYINVETAVDTLYGLITNFEPAFDHGVARSIMALREMEGDDVSPVVTCGECKYWADNGSEICSCSIDAILRERDFFCSCGERKNSLKPCPFCGSEAEYYYDCDMVKVRCSNCDCECQRVSWFDEAVDAAEEWNKRSGKKQ